VGGPVSAGLGGPGRAGGTGLRAAGRTVVEDGVTLDGRYEHSQQCRIPQILHPRV